MLAKLLLTLGAPELGSGGVGRVPRASGADIIALVSP